MGLFDFEKYRTYFNANDTFSRNTGMTLAEVGEGYSKVELTIDENCLNYMGTMHGGLLYTMADVAAGTALVFRGKHVVTLSAHTEYIKAAAAGKLIAVCNATSIGKTIGRCEVEIRSDDGTLHSKSSITMFTTDKDLIIPE
jgi:acyl-CoA thioesterase